MVRLGRAWAEGEKKSTGFFLSNPTPTDDLIYVRSFNENIVSSASTDGFGDVNFYTRDNQHPRRSSTLVLKLSSRLC